MDDFPGLDMRVSEHPRSTDHIQLGSGKLDVARPTKLLHQLRSHPLMTLESFVALARRRPPAQVRLYNAQNVTAGEALEGVAERHGGGSLEAMLAGIEQNKTYMFIMNVETDSVYRPLIVDLLEELKSPLRECGQRMARGWGWVFISAPNTVTPYHRDHERTCLLQLQGTKTLSVWRPQHKEVCSEAENEFFHTHASLQKTVYDERFQPLAESFELTPGEALYMPYTAPHWVQNGAETSVSFSVTFTTAADVALTSAYRMNGLLRRVGVTPRPVGVSAMTDALKEHAWYAAEKARSALRKLKQT